MDTKQFRELGELVAARDVRALLGIRSEDEWTKVRRANPQIAHRVPGMKRARYLKMRVLALLPAE